MPEISRRDLLAAAPLLAAPGLLFFSGCKSTTAEQRREAQRDLRSYVAESVAAERRPKANGLLDKLDALLKRAETANADYLREVLALHRRYETTDAELLKRDEAYRKVQATLHVEGVELHLELRGALSPEEWTGFAERKRELAEASLTKKGLA